MFGNSEYTFAIAILFQIVLISISITLTIHVLLHKSDPKASILWIALLWLAPVFGVILYFLFGINRIERRARRLIEAQGPSIQTNKVPDDFDFADDPWIEFRRLGNRITRYRRTAGNEIEIIEGIEASHTLMLDAIRSARKTILLSTYIFKRDDLGKAVRQELIKADQRDVDVKVLLDGVGNGLLSSKTYHQFIRGGVDVRRFLHSKWPWRMPRLNLRNHRKLLIVDSKIGFTGSMNIGRVRNHETHFKISGPIIRHFTEAFDFDWRLSGGNALRQEFRHYMKRGDGQISARGILSGPIYRNERLRWIILGALGVAAKKIRIVTPYFIPDRGVMSGLILASLQGVKIEIILPQTSNFPFLDWASTHQMQDLIEAGCQIYRRADVFDHSKILTIDGRWALIGSSNWDARSLRLNFEFDLECDDAAFVACLDDTIDQRLVGSKRLDKIELESRSLFKKLRDAVARLMLPYL